MDEIVYLVHSVRKGKPMPFKKKNWEGGKLNILRDGWRLATIEEIKEFYEVEEVKEEKPKRTTKKKTEKPEEKPE